MSGGDPVVEIRGLIKHYGGLRPLRIEQFDLRVGQSVALLGLDQAAAEVLVNLVTGATLPDTGVVRALGRATSEIADAEAWLQTVDQFGLVSERSVLVDQLTAAENLALRFSFDLSDLPEEVRRETRLLAEEVALSVETAAQPVGALSPGERLRVRLGRALALTPRVLVAEHPNASLPADDVSALAADVARIVSRRGIASLIITADPLFARAVAEDVLTLQPSTGELRRAQGWRRWFS